MGQISDLGSTAFRDYQIEGVPASGLHEPVKSEVRATYAIIDIALASLGVNGAITVKAAVKSTLDGDLAHSANTLGIVYNDVAANNGIYAKVGSSGSGSWSKTALALPSSFAADLAAVMAGVEGVDAALADALALYGSLSAVQAATVQAEAAAAQTAADLQEITEIASGSPEAPSILNKAEIATAPVNISVGSGGDFATLQEAVDSLEVIARTASVTITLLGWITVSSGTGLIMTSPYGHLIKIRGQAPTSTTLTGIVSVTGSAGAWSVTGTLADASQVQIGSILRIKNVRPGYESVYTFSGRPTRGAIRMPRVVLGKLSTVGTAATTSMATVNDWLISGDIIVAKGQVRRITGLTTSGFTLSSALNADVTGLNWWFYLSTGANGTVSVSGKTVTGTGTNFQTRLNPGDFMAVVGRGICRIASIESETALTLEEAMGASITGAVWTYIQSSMYHEGAWKVTAKSGSNVTWTHTGRDLYAPPVHHFSNFFSADVQIHNSGLRMTGTGQFANGVVVDTTVDLDNLAIDGLAGGGYYGIDLRGSPPDRNRPGRAILGKNVCVTGFLFPVYSDTGGYMWAEECAFSSGQSGGVQMLDGTDGNFNNAVSNGHAGRGLVIGYGSTATANGARAMGCEQHGLWAPGSVIAESFVGSFNLLDGVRAVGGGFFSGVQCWLWGNGFNGLTNEDSDGGARSPGALVLGCRNAGLSVTGGGPDHTAITISGCKTGYITKRASILGFEDAGITYNATIATVDSLSVIDKTNAYEIAS